MSIHKVRIELSELKCDGCDKILIHRMYLNLEELLVEQYRFHFCVGCKAKRQKLKKETGYTLIEETYDE